MTSAWRTNRRTGKPFRGTVARRGHREWREPRLYTAILQYSDGKYDVIEAVSYSPRKATNMIMDARSRPGDVPVAIYMHNISLRELGGKIKRGLQTVGSKIKEGIIRAEVHAGISDEEIRKTFRLKPGEQIPGRYVQVN